MARPQHSTIQHAIIQPWGIRVQRKPCNKRLDGIAATGLNDGLGLSGSGNSGWGTWHAVSESLFLPFTEQSEPGNHGQPQFASVSTTSDTETDVGMQAPRRVHHGLVDKLVDVERIVEISDARTDGLSGVQAVRFDATALLIAHGASPSVAWGGWWHQGQEAVACEDVWGVLLLPNVSMGTLSVLPESCATNSVQLTQFLTRLKCMPACGNVACLIDAGGSGIWWRVTQIQAAAVIAPDTRAHLVLALAGSPVLPSAGAWRAGREACDIAAAQALALPVIRRNDTRLWLVAECCDLFAEPALTAYRKHGFAAASHSHSHSHSRCDFVLHTGLQELRFVQPQLEQLAMKSSGEYGRLELGQAAGAQLWDIPSAWRSGDADKPASASTSQHSALSFQLGPGGSPTLGIDGIHFNGHWHVAPEKSTLLFQTEQQRLGWRYEAGDAHQSAARLNTEARADVTSNDWHISLRPMSLDLQCAGHTLLSLAVSSIRSGSSEAAHLVQPMWQWGSHLRAVQALWPDLLDSLNRASTNAVHNLSFSSTNGTLWPIVPTDKCLYIQHRISVPELSLGWGRLLHAHTQQGGWIANRPGHAWFGVTLGSAAAPLPFVMPAGAGVGTTWVQLGIGDAEGLAEFADGHDSGNPSRDDLSAVLLNIECPVNLSFDALDETALEVGSATVVAKIQARLDTPDRLLGNVEGIVHASALGGLARLTLAVQTSAAVWPEPAHVLLDAGVSVGIYLGTAGLLDIDFDAEWPLSASLARSA